MQLVPILSEVYIYTSAKDEVEWLPSEMRSTLYLLLLNIIWVKMRNTKLVEAYVLC